MRKEQFDHAAVAARLLSITGPLSDHQVAVVVDEIDGMPEEILRAATRGINQNVLQLTLKEHQAVDRAIMRIANTSRCPATEHFNQHLTSLTITTDC